MNKSKTYFLLTGFFLVSVLVRLPQLDRPLSKHHEFCTAVVLIPLENWAENGAATYHYSPSVSYEGAANHDIDNLTAHPVAADGRFYYLSHPPFAYLLPYVCFSIIGVSPTPLALQIFNLLFHFLSCVLLFQIVKMLVAPQPLKGSLHAKQMQADSISAGDIGGVTTFLMYLFAPATLWFHGNVYMSDMFISNIFILGIWLALKAFLRSEKSEVSTTSKMPDFLYALGVGFVIFLMIYTEWMGNFFAFGVFVLVLKKIFSTQEKHRRAYHLGIACACVLGVVAGLGLIAWQYSSIAGFEAYRDYFLHRFGARSGAKFADDGVFYFLWKYIKMTMRIARHYATGFLPILMLGLALWGVFIYRTKKIFQAPNIATRCFLWLAGFPILMHHLVFVEFTVVHDFAALKGGILIAVLVGLLMEKLVVAPVSLPLPNPIRNGLLLTIFLCVVQYSAINRPGTISQNGDRYDYMQTLGETIRDNAAADEVVFLNGYKPGPQVMYYAKRNMLRAADTTAAKKILEARGAKRGVLFTIENYEVKNVEKVKTNNKLTN